MDVGSVSQDDPVKKTPVVRGARACTVCRAAKMKCVGSEDGTKPCQRCKRANAECVFEKHRRGRKPGSKLSEASKMLRRLEKGLSSAKLKSQANDVSVNLPHPTTSSRTSSTDPAQYRGVLRPESATSTHFPGNELPPILVPSHSTQSRRAVDIDDDDDDDAYRDVGGLYPAKLIRKENRNSFFKTILNPEHEPPLSSSYSKRDVHSGSREQSHLQVPMTPTPPPTPPQGPDPITQGIMDENQAKVLFDLVFLRLNPFINLFDPALHSVNYVRSRCPFLFTTLLMAGAKFFKPEYYRSCQKLANDLANRVFSEAWKSVEVVQAFACLTYWKEPEDTRTWTYIGYACRMAVELGLNRRVSQRPHRESEFQLRERRNRERTYLVLFVHDRSLSMQTGRQWMLPECELVKRSMTWHEEAGSPVRPEDVIIIAFVQLRRIATETMEATDLFYLHRDSPTSPQAEASYEALLRNCNTNLTQWQETWQNEMQRASGESFHHAFLNFFRLYVRLFLNSFGIRSYIVGSTRSGPNVPALSACYSSALEHLQILTKDFAAMSVLRYGQDSVTIMSAYCAIFLLRLLRSSYTKGELHAGAKNEIYTVITQTADAYQDAAQLCPASGSAAYHARFLRSLIANDIMKARQDQEMQDPRIQVAQVNANGSERQYSHQSYSPQSRSHGYPQSSTHHFPTSPNMPSPPANPINIEYVNTESREANNGSNYNAPYPPQPAISSSDAHYWRNMFKDLGFGDSVQTMLHTSFGYEVPQAHPPQQYVSVSAPGYWRQ